MNKEFFGKNRKKIFDLMANNSMLVLASGVIYRSTADNDFDFEVDRSFYYFTGINQDNVTFILTKINNKKDEYLFIEENDPVKVKWIGAKLYKEEASELSGIKKVLYKTEFDKTIDKLASSVKSLYLNMDKSSSHLFNYNYQFSNMIKKNLPDKEVIDAFPMIVDLRFVKEKEEIELVKESIEVTRLGIERLMKESKPGLYEYQLECYFDFVLKTNGGRRTSFKTIAAGGVNATTLHYTANDTILKDNELVLFDLGTQTNFYISDISRTFPVNGKFTKRQKEIYEEVLNVNKQMIDFIHPGLTRITYNNEAKRLLALACKRLGLIKFDEDLVNYYWHGIGHSIGLDVHDPANYDKGIKAGSLMTVEPGLYIKEEGIGVRIEDNVIVTDTKAINLSASIIKETKDIEELMRR